MKAISPRKSSKRRLAIILAILLVLIGVGAGALYFQSRDAADRQKILDRDKRAAKTDGSAKKDVPNSSGTGLPTNPTTTTPDQVPTNPALSVVITSTSQSGGLVSASANTSGNGTCVFLYSAGDKDIPVSREVAATGSSCSVSISQNEFSYIGPWKLTVTFYSDGTKVEASKDVTVS